MENLDYSITMQRTKKKSINTPIILLREKKVVDEVFGDDMSILVVSQRS